MNIDAEWIKFCFCALHSGDFIFLPGIVEPNEARPES